MTQPQSPASFPYRKHPRWRVFVLGTVLFLSGAITGGALTMVAIQQYFKKPPLPPEKKQERLIDWMKAKLELEPAQVKPIQKIISQRMENVRQAQASIREQRTALRDDMANTLTPEQQIIWNQMWQERFGKSAAQPPEKTTPGVRLTSQTQTSLSGPTLSTKTLSVQNRPGANKTPPANKPRPGVQPDPRKRETPITAPLPY